MKHVFFILFITSHPNLISSLKFYFKTKNPTQILTFSLRLQNFNKSLKRTLKLKKIPLSLQHIDSPTLLTELKLFFLLLLNNKMNKNAFSFILN